MVNIDTTIPLAIVAVIAALILLAIRSSRRNRERRQQVFGALGFSSVDPPSSLVEKISRLYHDTALVRRGKSGRIRLSHVFGRRVGDGEMFVFDLIDVSGDEDSHSERQVVAVVSARLQMPTFLLFPKSDQTGGASRAANRLLTWLASKVAASLEFPGVPQFGERYLVISADTDRTRKFLDAALLKHFADTPLLLIHAGHDLFTLSRIGNTRQKIEEIADLVGQAESLFRLFQSGSQG